MTFARNSLYMLECRCFWIFMNTTIFTWMTNLFIGYEDIYCQCMIFRHRALIWSISLLAVHPPDSSTVRSDPRCARQKKRKKAARGVRFKSGLPMGRSGGQPDRVSTWVEHEPVGSKRRRLRWHKHICDVTRTGAVPGQTCGITPNSSTS